MADLTEEEMAKRRGHRVSAKALADENPQVRRLRDSNPQLAATLPNSYDWTTAGGVTPVKDQGYCGSCYAFSAVAAIESAILIKTGKVVSLSEQQIVDCNYENYGCNGGFMDLVYDYLQTKYLATSANYPYTAQDGSCQNPSGTGVVSVLNYDISPWNRYGDP